TDSSILVRSCPARPTKGLPCLSSSSPGPSPTTMSPARGLPEPKAIVVRLRQSLQRMQPWSASCGASRALAASIGGGAGAESALRGSSVTPRSRWWRSVPARARSAAASSSRSPSPGPPRAGARAGVGGDRGLAKGQHAVEDGVGDGELGHLRQLHLAAPAVEEHHLVVVRPEADADSAHVIGNQEVDALGGQL